MLLSFYVDPNAASNCIKLKSVQLLYIQDVLLNDVVHITRCEAHSLSTESQTISCTFPSGPSQFNLANSLRFKMSIFMKGWLQLLQLLPVASCGK